MVRYLVKHRNNFILYVSVVISLGIPAYSSFFATLPTSIHLLHGPESIILNEA